MNDRSPGDYPLRHLPLDCLRYCWQHPDYAARPLATEFLARYAAAEALLITLPGEVRNVLGEGRGSRLLDVHNSIFKHGYWPTVPMISHPFGNKGLFAVVPGNERLCSLLAIRRFAPSELARVLPGGCVPVRVALPGDVVDDMTPADLLFPRPA